MANFITTKVNNDPTNGKLNAVEWNQNQDLNNAVITSGQTPSDTDLYQYAKAMATYNSLFYNDSGTANSYILTPKGSLKAPNNYFDGMTIKFRAGNNNTGASVINVASLGSKDIKKADGVTDLTAGDITTGFDTELRYDGTVFRISSTNPSSYALLTYAVSSGTNGGANVAGAWTTRPINTENFDSNNIVSLSANQFTLVTGTYLIESRSVFYTELNTLIFCKSRIRNITDSSTLILGESIYADIATGSSVAAVSATPKTLFSITSSKTFELQYYCGTVNAADGLGKATSTGDNEVYASIFIQKL